jgi:hypothetical protein
MRVRLLLALTLPALLVAVGVAARSLAADEELLINGDFSRGTDGWTPYNDLVFDATCDGHMAYPAARLDVSDRGWINADPVAIEPGGTYEVSGWARFGAGTDPELRLGIWFYESADGTGTHSDTPSASLPVNATTYTSISTSSLAPLTAHSARLHVELSSGPATACVDDLSLVGPRASPTTTPTPTVQAPSPIPTSPPSPTTGPTATATAIPMPSGSILNGGFEQGEQDIPSVWQKFGGFLSRSTATPRSGSFSGAFSSTTSSTKWVYQPLVVEPGRSYDFHGYVLNNGLPESIVLLRISWYSTADASGDSIASSDSPESLSGGDPSFRYLSTGSVTAPPDAHSARARIVLAPASASAETIYLDDFALEETDPPTPTPGPTETGTPAPSETATPAGSPLDGAGTAAVMARGWLLNGGFEEGEGDRPVAWQKFGGFLYRSTAVSRSGSFAGGFSSTTAATKWVYQPVIVEPGRWYSFQGFVLKNGPPESTVFLRVSWYSTADASGASFASSDSPESLLGSDPLFRYLSTGSVVAPPEARSARARIILVPASAAPEGIYMDDFVFQETLPATPAATEGQDEPAQAAEPPTLRSGASDRQSGRSSAEPTPGSARRPAYDDSPYVVKISEVLADPPEATGVEDADHEWVELYNAGRDPVELGGWSLVDNMAEDALPPTTLPAGAYAVVAASPDFRDRYADLHGHVLVVTDGKIGNGLANEGDRLLLLDEEGRPVDALSYGSDREFFEPAAPAVPAGHSLERFPPDRDTDTAADFRDNPHPSPGTGPLLEATPTATALSEVLGLALSPSAGNGAASWPWLLLAGGLVFVGGTGAGAAGVLFWLARGRRVGT